MESLPIPIKMKFVIISVIPQPICGEWVNLYSNKIEIIKSVYDADYIIFESNSDPVQLIEHIKTNFPKEKLVFILSGDVHNHIDNECMWFTNAVKPSGLALKQTQIFVTNPAIFKYYEILKKKCQIDTNLLNPSHKTDIYFKGTIWDGMRTDMYNAFVNKPNCKIIKNNEYWKWRCESAIKPTQIELENTAYESYNDISTSKLCLCPKGNGNSSMRIIEAIVCGSIPILINDFSSPFGLPWGGTKSINNINNINNISDDAIGLVFNTKIHSWEDIYYECMKLINNKPKYESMKKRGLEYFEKVIYADSKLEVFKMYNNIDTVAFGFSKNIVDKLYDLFIEKNRIINN